MKPSKLLVSGVLCALLFNGCAHTESPPSESAAISTQESVSNEQTYREVILQLQQQLETLREAQLQQSNAYEAQIQELEAVIEQLTSSDSSNLTDTIEAMYTYTTVEKGVEITSYLGTDTVVKIPTTLNGFPVVGIGEGAFRNSAVERVVIPDGVTAIDWFAFYGSYRLQSVVIPASVSAIEYGAFELCSSSLKFTCESDSYAARYAQSYGIPVIFS